MKPVTEWANDRLGGGFERKESVTREEDKR